MAFIICLLFQHFLPIVDDNVDILLEELKSEGPILTENEAQEMVQNAKQTQTDQTAAKKCC